MNFSDLRSTGPLAVVRRELRPFFGELRRLYFIKVWGMDIGPGCAISYSAKLDKSYPRGIHIGEGTAINFGAVIMTHDTPAAFTQIHGLESNVISAQTASSWPASGLATIAWSRRRAW